MFYTDVMLDLETLGNKSNSAILSIGAVQFNLETGETGKEFYQVVDLQSCLDLGLKINGSTFYWWLQQNKAAQNAVCKNGLELPTVLSNFYEWMNDCIGNVNIWGNGARFDIGILEDAYIAAGYSKMPWYFRSERDVRTLVAFAPDIKNSYLFTGVRHNPIDDCKHQIGYCVKTWKKLNK
jgi:hypothetical protein